MWWIFVSVLDFWIGMLQIMILTRFYLVNTVDFSLAPLMKASTTSPPNILLSMTAAKQPTYPEVSQQIFSISLGFCCDDLWFSNTGGYPSLSQYPHHHVVEHY
jgi:hypothetical protein